MATILENRISAVELDGGQAGNAPIFGIRAWVNFNGTGTVAVNGSGNVSSITDNGTGDYTINFTTALPNANYAVSCQTTNLLANNQDLQAVLMGTIAGGATLKSTTQCRINVGTISAAALNDAANISVLFIG